MRKARINFCKFLTNDINHKPDVYRKYRSFSKLDFTSFLQNVKLMVCSGNRKQTRGGCERILSVSVFNST